MVTASAHGATSSALSTLHETLRRDLGERKPALVMVFASTTQSLDELMKGLSERFAPAVVLGASTSGEFVQSGTSRDSVVAVAVAGDYKVFAGIGKHLKEDPTGAVASALANVPKEVAGYPHRTGVVLLDPLSGNGEEVTLMVAMALGGEQAIAGGAAGDDLKMKSTRVGCGSEVSSDAIVFAQIFSKQPLGLGISHGHRALSGPLRVTKATGNVVHEIDGRPAWAVWVEQTRDSSLLRNVDPATLPLGDEGAHLLRYEAGLPIGDDLKVRAPLSRTADGSISFACGMIEGTEFRITQSSGEAQVASARHAAQLARDGLHGRPPAGAIVFDCICRHLILADAFNDAIGEMSKVLGGTPFAGFETYGEIGLDVGQMSGFHNTTSVVLAFPK